jgi:hypothetical protein
MSAARRRAALAVAACALLCGCATKKNLGWEWAEPAASWDEASDDEAVGVVLLAEQRFVFQKLGMYGEARAEVHYHVVQKLLTEAGIDAMATTVPWPKKATLLHLDARTIGPDGTITPLTEEQLFADETKQVDETGASVETNLRRFTFPRVEVGSIIELAWGFEMPGLYTGWQATSVLLGLPIKKYRVEIVVDAAAQPDFMVVNHRTPPRLVDHGDGMQHLVLELTDLPAREREAYAPPSGMTEPWWLYRTIAYRYPPRVFNMNATWDDAVRGRLYHLLVKGKGREGVALKGARPCEGKARCLVEAALDQVRENVAWTGHDAAFDSRSLNDLEPSGAASSAEKALLLWALLDGAGVEARVAGLARANTREVDKSFPHLAWLNHTVVVATVEGAEIWLDPSCGHCRPGELPSWSRGQDALVVFAKSDELKTEWKKAVGRAPPILDERQGRFTARILDDGTAEVHYSFRASGEPALEACRSTRFWDDEDWRSRAGAMVRAWSRAAKLVKSERGLCEKNDAAYTRALEARVPAFAAHAGEEILVPLSFLESPVSLPRHKPRKQDFVVAAPSRWDDELRVQPPPGFTLGPAPAAFEQKVKGASLRVDVAHEEDVLVVRRVLTLEAGTTTREQVKAVGALLEAADLAHRSVVLVRREPPPDPPG